MRTKKSLIGLLIFCLLITAVGVYLLGGLDQARVEAWLAAAGFWAPLIYICLYTIGTLLILPSTPLNLAGGAIFGLWWGTLWTSLAAVIAAGVGFWFTRTWGRDWMAARLRGQWEAIDAEMHHGGLFYLFAIRLLPLIPYGIVNFAAGLTAIRARDYAIATLLGTVPGILPFVMIGSGLQSLRQGDILPILFALSLTGLLVGGATWYRRHRQPPKKSDQTLD